MSTTASYLRALAERTANPIDWRSAPATYLRYPPAGRVVLPWRPVATGGLALVSTLLRNLLGPRPSWAHPSTETGLPAGGQPQLTVRRAAPSGGSLYPIEAYLALGPTPEAGAGLYHYDAAHHSLDLVRAGDHRAALTGLLATPPATLPDLVLVFSAVFWRNGFKYGDFAYRLQCQETGVLTAQALALAEALNLTATVHLRFAEQHTPALLGTDADRQGQLAILTFSGLEPSSAPASCPSLADLLGNPVNAATNPPPSVAESLPLLLAMHTAASHCRCPDEAQPTPTANDHSSIRLPTDPSSRLAEGIPARASALHGYLPTAADLETLVAVLAHAAGPYPGDLPHTGRSVTPYLLAQRVTGLRPGAYRYHPDTHTLTQVGKADAVEATHRGPLLPNTFQALPEAAAVLIPAGDPRAGVDLHGDRWYRMQQIEAGLMAHRATLTATAHGLGSRLHSDGTNDTTDAALGLRDTGHHALSFLLLGQHRPGPHLQWI